MRPLKPTQARSRKVPGKTKVPPQTLRLFAPSHKSERGVLALGSLRFPVALGRSGIAALKKEGDGATPLGRFTLRRLYYRPDRLMRPRTALPLQALKPENGWCDASFDRNYNRPVPMPYPASAERLWRQDQLYDLILELDYNVTRRVQGRGSAIFMHVARRNFGPTAGCLALKHEHLVRLVAHLRPGSAVCIG